MMAINEITDAEIREYILGKGPAEKAERLDELSFFDEYTERIGAMERELVDDYVSENLNPGERLAFESHYLSSPIRRERVRFASALAKYSDEPHPAAGQISEKASIFDLFRQRFFVLQLGAAALLLVLIGTFAWVVFRERTPEIAQNAPADPVQPAPSVPENTIPPSSPAESPTAADAAPVIAPRVIPERPVISSTPRPSKPKEAPPSLATFVLTPALRSPSFQTIEIPSGANTAEFRLLLEVEDADPIAAEVVDMRTQSRIWSSQKVSPRKGRSGSTASIQVPAQAFKAGEYRITLSRSTKDKDPEKIGDYFFRVSP
jgi:hypothetical protein